MALLSLAGLLWRAWRPAPTPDRRIVVAATSALPSALTQATRSPVAALDLTLDSIPGVRDRAWARAIGLAGTRVRWHAPRAGALGDATLGVAAMLEPLADPNGRVRLTVTSGAGVPVAISDAAGALDSATMSAAGVRVLDAIVDGPVVVSAGRGVARTVRRDSLRLRPVLVLARAGWEGKFVVAALEEAGWRVDARFAVAPRVQVRQGSDVPLDTSRYAAVVVLDASADNMASAVARFVRSGGGAVIAASAARLAPLAAILPARAGDEVSSTLGALVSDAPRRGLGGLALTGVRPDAVVLERSDRAPRLVAARVEAGRVLLSGYEQTWRWRMEGGDDAPAAHRAWWSGLVSSVARAPLVPLVQLAAMPEIDEVPLSALVEALGPASSALADVPPAAPPVPWDTLLFTILVAALLAEWWSRRLRGAR